MTNNGNLAAMREALENYNELLEELATIGEWGESAREQIAKNNSVLSAPARNCDVFESEDESKAAFIKYYNEAFDLKGSKYEIDYCDLKHDVDGILHDYIDWLFAPANQETELESDQSN